MNNTNSIIEIYRKNVCKGINTSTYKDNVLDPTTGKLKKDSTGRNLKVTKDVLPVWESCMQKHIGLTPAMTSKEHAEKIFNLGEHLRDIFYSTKPISNTATTRGQDELSNGGALWEKLVTYYLNYCLANTRTVVFMGAKTFKATETAVTFNTMNSASEVDLLAITFPDRHEFTDDINIVKTTYQTLYPDCTTIPPEFKCVYNNRIGNNTFIERFSNALVAKYFNEIEVHVIQCKTNWNDSIQSPMLWSLLYYLSRDKITLPTGSNIKFGSGKYTLPRLKGFSYSFASVPTQNNGEYESDPAKKVRLKSDFDNTFSDTGLPVKRGKLIRGGSYWGLPKYNSIYPISEMLNTNLSTGFTYGHVIDNIQFNIDHGLYGTDYSYFCNL